MPFSNPYQLLATLGVNPLLPGAGSARTPGITPGPTAPAAPGMGGNLLDRLSAKLFGASDPTGMLTPEQQQAAQRQGLLGFGASLLANSGPQPGPGIGFGAALGQALQAGQAASSGGIQDQLQGLLLKSRIQENERQSAAATQDPALVAEYKFAQANGFAGSFQDYIKSKQQPVQQPAAIQEAQYFATLSPEQQRQYLQIKRATETPFRAAEQAGASGALDQRTGAFIPQVTAEQNQAAAAGLKAAEAGGTAAGKARGEFQAGYQDALNLVDDEILRTERLLQDFESGKYQTGPIAGALPSVRTAAQDLDREAGRDTLKGISSAVFGQLTNEERKFVAKLGINPSANEASNINLLRQRQAELQRTKQRLLSKGQTQQQGGATGSFGASTPNNVNSLVERYRTKK